MENLVKTDPDKIPGIVCAILPIIAVIAVNLIFSKPVFAGQDPEYLKTEFNTAMATVMGTWFLIIALIVGIILCLVLNWKSIKSHGAVTGVLKDGAGV